MGFVQGGRARQAEVLIDQYLYYYPAALLYLCLGIAILFGWQPPSAVAFSLGILAIVFFLAKTAWLHPEASDFAHNWIAGKAWLDGSDPYPISIYMNYPPYTLPLFSILALIPFTLARFGWIIVTVLAAITLVPLAWFLLDAAGDKFKSGLTRSQTWILLGGVILSIPVHFSVTLGQPAILVAMCLFSAVLLQIRNRPIWSGILMAIAFIKPQSAVPFLLLFLKKKAIPVWITAGVIVLALSAISSSPKEYPLRLREVINNNSQLTREGGINDYTDKSTNAHTMLGLDRLVYCLGVTNRSSVRAIQFGVVAILGLFVAWQVVVPNQLSHDAAISIVAIYTLLFTYHRTPDAVLLAVPLLYVAGRAIDISETRRRWAHLTAAFAILAILFVHPRFVDLVGRHCLGVPVIGAFVRVFIVPCSNWLLLLILACIWAGRRVELSPHYVSSGSLAIPG